MPDLPASFDPRRFRTAAPYYARYRLAYPAALIRKVLELTQTRAGDAALDLGCGPGTLSIPLAREGLRVTAVDPEPEMLTRAQAAAQEANVTIDFRRGSSFAMPEDVGPFHLATMGRAFHWMDRPATLASLDATIAPGGAVVHFDDEHPKTIENAWRRVLRDIGDKWGREQSPHVAAAARPDYRTHESVFFDSPFSRLQRYAVFVRREIHVDDVVGLAYSLSTTSPQKLGARKDEFERELRTALSDLSPGGRFVEIAELSALIARR